MREPRQRREERTVELVVVGWTEIAVRTVPAPLPVVVPIRKYRSQPLDAVAEQPEDAGVIDLRPEVVQPEQTEETSVEHPRQRNPRVFLVHHEPPLHGPHSSILDVLLEHLRGAGTLVQQVLLAGD